MKKIQVIGNRFKEVFSKHSPAILTAAAVGGLVTTAIFAVRATPKALEKLDEEVMLTKTRKFGVKRTDVLDYFTKKEIIQLCWKEYIPCYISGGVTIACIIGANTVQNRRHAALASLYSVTETSLREYQTKVREVIGEKKESAIRDEIAKDKVSNNPPSDNTILLTGRGDVTCFDSFSGRYFKSDIETIRKTVNDLTELVFLEDFVPINSFYHEIGLDGIKMGEETGWASENGTIDFHYSSQLTNGEPVLVIDYTVTPYTHY